MPDLPLKEAIGHFYVQDIDLLMLSRQANLQRRTVSDIISPLVEPLLQEFVHPCLKHTLRLHDSSLF